MSEPTKPQALIVDDEPDIRELLQLTLERMGIDTQAAEDLGSARHALARHKFELCLTDMRLPDGNGIDLVKHVQQEFPEVPIAVITAHGNMESAIDALKAGAFDFLSKPVDLQVLRKLITATLKLSDRSARRERRSRHVLLGDSPVMQAIRGTIAKLARNQAPVYISGESGTGKELIAHLIHQKGPRADKPFVPVNCGAIPEDLMESEFFGHRKGSFTGAAADKDGLFQAADGGTLFLDELADLPLHMQVKLLRAIQEKAVRSIGARQEIPVDVRILSATHEDLAALVPEGRFRQDLYYRINVIELHAPNLRERPEDIPILAEYVLEHLDPQAGTPPPRLSAAALAALQKYDFPGNVRELENILERALALYDGDTIEAGDLGLPQREQPGASDVKVGDLDPYLEGLERDAIMSALEKARFNKTAAAKLLGISFRALRYRLKKLNLD